MSEIKQRVASVEQKVTKLDGKVTELDHFINELQQFGRTKTQIVFSTSVEQREVPVVTEER